MLHAPDLRSPSAMGESKTYTTTKRPILGRVLLSLLLAIVGVAWFSISYRFQQVTEALRTIRAANGIIQIEDGGPDWLRSVIGDSRMILFDRVVRIDFHDAKCDDRMLRFVGEFTDLRELNLSSTGITDRGLDHLHGLRHLTRLHLRDTNVTDEGLSHLASLDGLDLLALSRTSITDAGLAHLTTLSKLTWLDLGDTAITDAGIVHLKLLTSLKSLSLGDTRVTEAGIQELKHALPTCTVHQ